MLYSILLSKDGIHLLKSIVMILHFPTLLISLFFISINILMQINCLIFCLLLNELNQTVLSLVLSDNPNLPILIFIDSISLLEIAFFLWLHWCLLCLNYLIFILIFRNLDMRKGRYHSLLIIYLGFLLYYNTHH